METSVRAPDTFIIKLIHGDIVTAKADVCVTSVHRSKVMSKGVLSSHILRHAGRAVEKELRKVNGRKDLEHGQVAMISPGNMSSHFQQLVAVCLYSWRPGNDSTLMRAVSECLMLAHSKSYTSIVFPALGMGGQNYPPYNVARAIMAAIVKFKFSNQDSSLRTVYIALNDKNENSIRTFLKTISTFLSEEWFRDDLDGDGDTAIVIEGMEEFKELKSTEATLNTENGSRPHNTSKLSTTSI